MNYYEHHLGDYLRDTAHLSMLEDGAYRRLLDVYYVKEQPIPADLKDACRLVRALSKQERDAVYRVLREFFEADPDGWRHKRCDIEIARYQDKQAKAKRSAEARWGASRAQSDGNANASPDAHADDMRTHSEGNAPRARPQAPSPKLHPPVSERVGRSTTRGTRLDPDWQLPEDWRTWALAERPDLDPDKTAARFRDYWLSVPGNKATRSSWVATWRNWVRNERADQVRPHLNGVYARGAAPEPAWRREQRERTQQAAPYAAARSTADPKTIDEEPANALARIPT